MDAQRPGTEYKSQVIAATNIVELIGRTVSLKKAGKNYTGLCPFHSEKTPSFTVHPAEQFFYCHGCKKGGDAITFVMERDRLEFRDALKLLADAAGIESPAWRGASKEKAGERKLLLDANSAAGMFFEKLLADPVIGKSARAYLQQRGFNEQSIKSFHIGFAADAWDALLKAPAMKGFAPARLAAAGLVKSRESGAGGFYDTFRNRLMFPIRDENGRVIAFGGRAMPGSDDKTAKYLNSPETPLFSKSRCLFGLDLARQKIVETRTVAVVEGYTDVIMAHQFGASNVVSPLGTALSEGHVQILRRFAEKIVLLFDADSAGDTAANRAVELFLTQPVEIAIASIPNGMDPDEFLLASGLSAFEGVLKNATDALTYTWKQLIRKFNGSGGDLTGQQKAVQEYLQMLAGARESGPVDPMRWGSAVTRVSRLTEIPADELNRMFRPKKNRIPVKPAAPVLETQDAGGNEPTKEAARPAGPLTARDRSERWILAILLNESHRWADIQHELAIEHFADGPRRKLAELYWQHQRDEGEVVFNEFFGSLNDAELVELAVSLIEESVTMADVELTLNEAIAFLVEQKARDQAGKPLADLRRTSGSEGDVSSDQPGEPSVKVSPDDLLRKIQEQARRPDLRRMGR